MPEARRVKKTVMYNGRDISFYVMSIDFTDNTDVTDDISIKLSDRAERWYNEWFPETGDTLTVSIELINWRWTNDNHKMNFGSFEVDSVELTDTVTVKAVAVPITSSIRSEEKTKAWEKIRLRSIAGEMAARAKLILVYEADINPLYDRSDQNNKSDLAFLEELCKSDGLCVKVTDNQLVIFEESKYDRMEAVVTIKKGVSLYTGKPRFKRSAKNIYSACEISYTDSKTDKTYKGCFVAPNVGKVGHVLKLNEKFNSKTDDMNLDRKAKARLREQNKNEWTVGFTMHDGVLYYAGTNWMIEGWHRFDGKYHIRSVSYQIGDSGFSVDLDMRRCLEGY